VSFRITVNTHARTNTSMHTKTDPCPSTDYTAVLQLNESPLSVSRVSDLLYAGIAMPMVVPPAGDGRWVATNMGLCTWGTH